MLKFPRIKNFRKRPRVFQHINPDRIRCGQREWYCGECMANFAAQAEYERPGHVWAVDKGKVIFLEDVVVEHRMGRKLHRNESVVHRNGDVLDNRDANLEVVSINEKEIN